MRDLALFEAGQKAHTTTEVGTIIAMSIVIIVVILFVTRK